MTDIPGIAGRLSQTQRQIVLGPGGEIDWEEGCALIALGLFTPTDRPEDDCQGFDFSETGLAVRDYLRELEG